MEGSPPGGGLQGSPRGHPLNPDNFEHVRRTPHGHFASVAVHPCFVQHLYFVRWTQGVLDTISGNVRQFHTTDTGWTIILSVQSRDICPIGKNVRTDYIIDKPGVGHLRPRSLCRDGHRLFVRPVGHLSV